MKFLAIFLLFALANTANGIRLKGFRVKHAWSGALRDKEYFFNIPRNSKDAAAAGYVDVSRSDESYKVQMKCLDGDVRVCPLYDQRGYIAGIQIALPFNDLHDLPFPPSSKMVLRTILGEKYWTSTSYLTNIEKINNGGRHGPIDETIEYLLVENGNSLMNIPLGEAELASETLYKKENCIPNMGTHYYYNVTPEMDCKTLFPYFLSVKEGRVIGLGWQIFGRIPQKGRQWFEDAPAIAVGMTVPTAPPCLKDWVAHYGVISLHMFYVDTPWKIGCEEGDSLQPMSVVNRILLDTFRYYTKFVDNAKKLFG